MMKLKSFSKANFQEQEVQNIKDVLYPWTVFGEVQVVKAGLHGDGLVVLSLHQSFISFRVVGDGGFLKNTQIDQSTAWL